VPRGFAHAFATLEPDCLVQYKVSDVYAPDCDAGVRWSDPALGIDWQLPVPAEDAKLSDKDRQLPTFAEFESPFTYADYPDP
jgi:dTDP-4-dehydrorhamnose 3,5-epimerase